MDKFDEIMKNAVEGYDAPFDASAWDKVSSQLNSPFDQAVKDAADSYEAPMNSQVWNNISRQLGPASSTWKWIGGTAAALTLLIGGTYYMMSDPEDQTSNEIVKQDIANNDLDSDNNKVVIADENHENNNVITENNNDNTNPVDNVENPVDSNPLVIDHNPQDTENGNQNPEDSNTTTTDPNQNENTSTDNGTVDPIQEKVCNAHFNCDIIEACAGTEFIFSPEDMKQDVNYIWSFGDGTYGAGTVGAHKFQRSGNFTVTLSLNDKRTNKVLKTETRTIVVHPKPHTEFSWEESDNVIPSITFINLTDDAAKAEWDLQGLKTSSANQFSYTFRNKGIYMVSLTTENEFGCTSTVEKPISIENDYNLLAPTAFTPDGDGNNETFIPEALKLMNNPEFTMTVYDKGGKQVYFTKNVNQPWDGLSTEDNTPAPAGFYVWTVRLTNEYGEVEEYQGQVLIIR